MVVDFEPFGEYNKGQDILDGLNEKGFFVPNLWVCLESISFNHDPNCSSCDALNIRENFIEEVHIPEWKKGKRPYPAAFIKNKCVKVKVLFSAAPRVERAKIKAVRGGNNWGNLGQKSVSFNSGTSGPIYFRIPANIPNKIMSFYQEWHWYSQIVKPSLSPEAHIGSSKNKIYILLAKPQSPWATTGQFEPWVDALEYSCNWSEGSTTPEEAVAKITQHLYEDINGCYHYGSYYTGSDGDGFRFTQFIEDISFANNVIKVNCWDMGKSLVSLSNVTGCDLDYKQITRLRNCDISCVKEIGKEWNCKQRYDTHAFGSICDKVFDACLKVDSDWNPENHPQTESWATGILWEEYKKKLVKNCEPGYPEMYSFPIDGKSKKKIGTYLKKRIDWTKEKYNYKECEKDIGMVAYGGTLKTTIFPQDLREKNYSVTDSLSIEEIEDKTFSVIRKLWKSKYDQLDVTVVIGSTMDSVKNYLIIHYADTSRKEPLIKEKGPKGIGNICFVIGDGKSFSSIDFIHHNVLFLLQAEGGFREFLKDIAVNLNSSLLDVDKNCKINISHPDKKLEIQHFYFKKRKIKLGESVPIILKIKRPRDRKIKLFWKMTSGGVEKDCKGNCLYYGSEPGRHKITITVLTDRIDRDERKSKSYKFKVSDLRDHK